METVKPEVLEKVKLHLSGLELPPQEDADLETARAVMEAALKGDLNPHSLPPPRLAAHSVFQDERGDSYLVMPTEEGPLAVPYLPGTPFEPDAPDNPASAGFIDLAQMLIPSGQKDVGPVPDPMALIQAATSGDDDALVNLALNQVKAFAQSGMTNLLTSVAQDGLDDCLARADTLLSGFAGSGDRMSDEMLEKMTAGCWPQSKEDSLGLANGLPTLGAGGAGMLFDKGVDALLNDVLAVDDESSTAEHIAARAVEVMRSHVKEIVTGAVGQGVQEAVAAGMGAGIKGAGSAASGGMGAKLDRLRALLTGVEAGPGVPVAHVGVKDDGSDIVAGGAPTVLVEGKPIARAGDLILPVQKMIIEGSATVSAQGMPVARLGSLNLMGSKLVGGAASVSIDNVTV